MGKYITFEEAGWPKDTILVVTERFIKDMDIDGWSTEDLAVELGFDKEISRYELGNSIYFVLKSDDESWCPLFSIHHRYSGELLNNLYFRISNLMPLSEHIMEQINNLKAIEVKHGLSR